MGRIWREDNEQKLERKSNEIKKKMVMKFFDWKKKCDNQEKVN